MRNSVNAREVVAIIAAGICMGMVFNTFHKDRIPFIAPPKAEIYARKNIPTLTLEEAKARFDKGVIFVDARDPEEFEEGHVKDAISLPVRHLDLFYPKVKERIPKDVEIVVYCASPECNAGLYLAEEMVALKYEHIEVMIEGWEGWEKAGYPTAGEG
jgi:rhodanese-related sulfurtransferase